jgi:hypothetical protein
MLPPAAALISSRGSKLSEHLGQQFYIENIAVASDMLPLV